MDQVIFIGDLIMETYSTTFKARLGLFVLVASALFIAGIFYIGRQKHLFNPVFTLNTTFKNISGLQIGNNVRFSGINVGTVENISIIDDTTVMVSVIIDKNVQQFIKKNCFMTIGSEGLIGDKILSITQGSPGAASVTEGQYLPSVEPVETDAIMASLKVTGENAEVISYELADILDQVNNGNGTLARLIHDSTIAQNINQTIVNLKKSTRGLDENMEAAKHNILLRGYYKNKEKREREKNQQKEDEKKGTKKGATTKSSDGTTEEPKKRRSWLSRRTKTE
jgi:phospholipid/cholesterol/gamma-HCH transport system substrate-binding protein